MLTIVVPYWNGRDTIGRLVDSLPDSVPVVIVADKGSDVPSFFSNNISVIALEERGYFSGAVNAGIRYCDTDVLILNQDVWLEDGWQNFIEENKADYGIIGDGVFGHPAWPAGYVQGTFMFIRRDVIEKVGLLNVEDYPLWGSTCEYQLRACRAGFNALPKNCLSWLHHSERKQFGTAITKALIDEPQKKNLFIRTPPMISVIVPCFNYGRYLKDAIDSLMAQTFQSFEVIIVDDASTDDSAKIAESFDDPHKGIRVIKRAKRGGTAACINTGVKASVGRFITILSADDMFMPTRLEVLYRAALQNPHSVIYDDIIWRTPKGDSIKPMRDYDFDEMLNGNIMHASIFYPRQAWVEAGGYPEIMSDGREDWAFNVAIGQIGYCGVHIKQALFIYRRFKQNRSLKNQEQWPYFHEKIRALFPKLYLGERTEMCCGKKAQAPQQTQPLRQAASVAAARKSVVSDTAVLVGGPDMVLLRYIGRNTGTETWYGEATGRSYKFGLNRLHRKGFVHRNDAPAMLATKQFQREEITPHPSPVIVVEESPAIVEQATEPVEQKAEEVAPAQEPEKKQRRRRGRADEA